MVNRALPVRHSLASGVLNLYAFASSDPRAPEERTARLRRPPAGRIGRNEFKAMPDRLRSLVTFSNHQSPLTSTFTGNPLLIDSAALSAKSWAFSPSSNDGLGV